MEQPLTATRTAAYSNLQYHGTIYKELASEEPQIPTFKQIKKGSKELTCSPECQLQSTFLRTKSRAWIQFSPMGNFRKFPGTPCMLSELKEPSVSPSWALRKYHAFHLGRYKIYPNLFR